MSRQDFSYLEPPKSEPGHAEPAIEDPNHTPHTFLYIPDLSSQTGWAGHRVPERQERRERRFGFSIEGRHR